MERRASGEPLDDVLGLFRWNVRMPLEMRRSSNPFVGRDIHRALAIVVVSLTGCCSTAQQLIVNGGFEFSEACVVGTNCRVDMGPHWLGVSNMVFNTWKVQSGVVPDTEVLPVYCKDCDGSLRNGDTVRSTHDLALVLSYQDVAIWDGLFRYFVAGTLDRINFNTALLSFDYAIAFTSDSSKKDVIPFHVGFADTLDIPDIHDVRWLPCSGDGRWPVECMDLRSIVTVHLRKEPRAGPLNFEHFEALIPVPEGAKWILLGDINRPTRELPYRVDVHSVVVDNLSLQER